MLRISLRRSGQATATSNDIARKMILTESGAKETLNNTGFEMGQPSPLLKQWVANYDGVHPLVVIGCAFGRNSAAAVRLLNNLHGASTATRVIAIDCERRREKMRRGRAAVGGGRKVNQT